MVKMRTPPKPYESMSNTPAMTTTIAKTDVIIGLDVGKTHHYAYIIDRNAQRCYQGKVNQTEQALRKLYTKARRYGDTVMLVVDQPNNIGAFAVAVARDMGLELAYLTGSRMRYASRLHAGNSKTDPKDAQVIAHTALQMPETLQPLSTTPDEVEQLTVIGGHITDLIKTRTEYINRIRVMLLSTCPGLEQLLKGPALTTNWALAMLSHYPTPQAIIRAGVTRLTKFFEKHSPTMRNKQDKAQLIIDTLKQQTVIMPATDTMWISIKNNIALIHDLNATIQDLEQQAATIAQQLPEYEILQSMPGIGPRTAQTILTCVGDLRTFDTPAQFASYAGICPVTRQSGTSIKGEHVNRGGNKKLKNALWYSAFASIKTHERSRSYYQAKRDAGKRHNAAIMCLARRRANVIFAMLKNHTFYDDNYRATGHTPQHT